MLVGLLRRLQDAEGEAGWQGLEREINCAAHNETLEMVKQGVGSIEEIVETPRGETIDLVMSCIGGVLSGYLTVQFGTLLMYMNDPVLKPKQPHVLLWQTLAAMVLTSSLLIYHGHFRREARRTTPRAPQAPASVLGTSARPGGGGLEACSPSRFAARTLGFDWIRGDHELQSVGPGAAALGSSRSPRGRAPARGPPLPRGRAVAAPHQPPRACSVVRRMGC